MEEKYHISGRTGKQCRERWNNHINPKVNRHIFSEEEEKILFESHDKFGNKWSEIARFIKGRPDNMIKNYYYSTLRRQIRKITKNVKKIKPTLRKTKSDDLSIEYIYKLIEDNKLDISKLDNIEVKKRILLLKGINKLERINLNIQEDIIFDSAKECKKQFEVKQEEEKEKVEKEEQKSNVNSLNQKI